MTRPMLRMALPFWVSVTLAPLMILAAVRGGLWILAVPAATWWLFSALDALLGRARGNLDPATDHAALFWYRAVTRVWPVIQIGLMIFVLATVPGDTGLRVTEKIGIFFALGVLSGAVGIVYAHELMHQPGRIDRWLADILLASVFDSHFRSEHLLVHHRHVGTPRDTASAPMGEGFYAFFGRALTRAPVSAWRAERDRLAAKGLPPLHRSNPFWRYGALQAAVLAVAFALGGWAGAALMLFQGLVAIWQLELVNYIEHYGLDRRKRADGRYEPVGPEHSWNATQTATSWLLINLTRHSDHHMKPARPYPLLQSRDGGEAPMLPWGYPVMTSLAMIPPLWRRVMDPRVRRWRRRYRSEAEPLRAA